MHGRLVLCATLIVTAVIPAQQPNSSTASLTIDNVTGPPYPVAAHVAVASPVALRIHGLPGSPFALFASATGVVQAGSGAFAGGIVDLPLSPLPVIVLDGFTNPAFVTGPAGIFLLNLVMPPAGVPPAGIPLGPVIGLQAVVQDATSPFGLRLTAATQVTTTRPPVTLALPLGPSTTLAVSLGAVGITVPFYGANYTQIFVNANGYLTLGTAAPNQFSSNPGVFDSGPPRIAGLWTGIDPSVGGAVNLTTGSTPAAIPFARLDFVGVPQSMIPSPPTFSFSMLIDATGFVQIDHALMTAPSLFETSVGIGPGGNISPAAVKNLAALVAAGGAIGAVNEAFYGYYGIITQNLYYTLPYDNPYNLFGVTMNFLPIGSGGLPGSSNRYVMY